MSNRRGDFDDDEGFFESLLNRKQSVQMPDSMRKFIKIGVSIAVLTIIGLLAWAIWPNGEKRGAEVPIIRAETTDYKVEPEDKGGMPIPNKDSTVFEAMDDNATGEKKVESLLEDSEQPMKKDEAFADEKSTDVADTTTTTPSEEKLEEPAVTEEKAEVKKEEKADIKPVIKEEKKVEEKAEPKKEKKVDIIQALKEEAGTTKPKASGNVYIQLASVKSDADAKTKWAKLKSTFGGLSKTSLRVQKVDLGAKGTFYRVQAGPMSQAEASALCAKIKAGKGDCLIVK